MKKEISKRKAKATVKKGAKRELTKAEIMRKMDDPNISAKERTELGELLYKDIPIIKAKKSK